MRAILVEVDHAQVIGALDLARIRSDLAMQNAQQRSLAAAIRAGQSQPNSRTQNQIEIAKQSPAAELLFESTRLEQVLRAPARRGEVDLRDSSPLPRRYFGQLCPEPPGRVNARFRF